MKLFYKRSIGSVLLTTAAVTVVILLAGCTGIPTSGEKDARREFSVVTAQYRDSRTKPDISLIQTNSSLSNLLYFAMINQPNVEAAYFDWAASIERITRERSLPDPRLSFETDITDMVMTVMPGIMMDFPGPGKLKAAAAMATAESWSKYFRFEGAVLETAFNLKRAYFQLHFLTEKIRVNRETLGLLTDLELIARKQNEVGKVTSQDVLRAQIEQDRLATEIANLEDSELALIAQYKGALGLAQGETEPPRPLSFETVPLGLDADQLLRSAMERNPRLRTMAAEVKMAEASIRLANKARIPDFTIGLEADAKAAPVMYRPLAGMTLPIWRDKIAAQIAEAQGNKNAAQARLSAEQIALAIEVADKSYMVREATRNLRLVETALLPKARQSLEVARAGYLAGQIDFFNLMDAWKMLLEFQLSRIETQTQREIAIAELSLVIAGLPPEGAPILRNARQAAKN